MSSPVRLDDQLVKDAKREGSLQKRSVPRQIEYWAMLGRTMENVVSLKDAVAVQQGIKALRIEPATSPPVDSDAVFDILEMMRENGSLSKKVSTAAVYYEATPGRPGFLDKVDTQAGTRQTGQFRNGEFELLG